MKIENNQNMSESEFENTPPEFLEAANRASQDLLPTKSKVRYEKCYQQYQRFCHDKGAKNFSSETVLIAYFSKLAETKKASTLWATYSMLRATLSVKNQIDISKYATLIAYLKKQNIGYSPKKSSVFSRDQIDHFFKNATSEYLPLKVALIIGISGACRTDELYKMKQTDVEFLNKKISILIPNTKTYHPRSFVITNSEWIEVVARYINLRKHVDGEKFFLQLRFGKITKQPYGHNTLDTFPKKIALFLGLSDPKSFTGHCFRRTAATLLANRGGDILQLKRLGGWKSSGIAEGYVESSSDGQEKVAKLLSSARTENPHEQATTSIVTASTSTLEFNFSHDDRQHGISFTFNTYDSSNVTINVNKP